MSKVVVFFSCKNAVASKIRKSAPKIEYPPVESKGNRWPSITDAIQIVAVGLRWQNFQSYNTLEKSGWQKIRTNITRKFVRTLCVRILTVELLLITFSKLHAIAPTWKEHRAERVGKAMRIF